jgi:hypothetical protein
MLFESEVVKHGMKLRIQVGDDLHYEFGQDIVFCILYALQTKTM